MNDAVRFAQAAGSRKAATVPPPTASASVEPLMVGEKLSAVQVTVQLRGGADGRTVMDLPDDFAGEKERWRRLRLLKADDEVPVAERCP